VHWLKWMALLFSLNVLIFLRPPFMVVFLFKFPMTINKKIN
jgi:hypothetical protein